MTRLPTSCPWLCRVLCTATAQSQLVESEQAGSNTELRAVRVSWSARTEMNRAAELNAVASVDFTTMPGPTSQWLAPNF